jgi:hypothetical protein
MPEVMAQAASTGRIAARRVYEVEELGKNTCTVLRNTCTNKESRKWERQTREAIGGYMVYFPQGHSIYVETKEQLRRLNLHQMSGFVDMNTGLMVEDAVDESIKERVMRNTSHTPAHRRRETQSFDQKLIESMEE